MKFTQFFILCNKTLGLTSPTLLLLFVFNIDVTISRPKIKKKPLLIWLHSSLSRQIMFQQWLKLYWKSHKKLSENCRNIVTLLPLEQQLTLFMRMWLSHVLGNHQKNRFVYSFTLYKLCIILSFLCFTAHKVTFRTLGSQQTGTELHG